MSNFDHIHPCTSLECVCSLEEDAYSKDTLCGISDDDLNEGAYWREWAIDYIASKKTPDEIIKWCPTCVLLLMYEEAERHE